MEKLSSAVLAALQRRTEHFAGTQTDSYRLLNRAADGAPDLALDKFNDLLIAHLYSDGQTAAPPRALLQQIQGVVRGRSVYLKYRPRQASRLTEAQRAALAPTEPLFGESLPETIATENGTRYLINPTDGLSVGLFLDMRDQRAWVKAHAPGKTVLNCFAYTCAFGLVAQQGGALRAVNLDVSKAYLDWGKRNAQLNNLTVDPRDYIFGDVFDWLKRFARSGQKFDLVILDPPSYSTTKQTRFSVERDYDTLIALAATVTAPGGHILACANAAELPLSTFTTKLRSGLANHRARILSTSHEPALDFPVIPGAFPYLKAALIKLGA